MTTATTTVSSTRPVTESSTEGRGVRFARRVFSIAGWYGLVVMLPNFFLEAKIGRDFPPAITHPENYYGFICVTLAWQVLFLIIARDPVRFRAAMIAAVLEKFPFVFSMSVLYAQGRVAPVFLAPVAIDFVLGLLFIASYRATPSRVAG